MRMKKNVLTVSLSVAALAGLTFLSSCLKNDDNTPQQPVSGMSFLQASPGAPSLDLYLNGEKANSKALTYNYYSAFTLNSADYAFSVVNGVTQDTLLHHQDSLQPNMGYSMIVYDTGSAMKLMFSRNQASVSQNNSDMYVRFLHLSPNTGPVKIMANSDDLYASRHFADNVQDPSLEKFEPMSQGTYSFTAIDAANGDTLGHVDEVGLQSGGLYTLYLRGLSGRTDTLGVQLDIMINNNY